MEVNSYLTEFSDVIWVSLFAVLTGSVIIKKYFFSAKKKSTNRSLSVTIEFNENTNPKEDPKLDDEDRED